MRRRRSAGGLGAGAWSIERRRLTEMTGGAEPSTPSEHDGCIDEGADARSWLGCAECDSELHLLSKVRERPEYELRKAQSAHGFRRHRHAVAGGGHAERRHEIADVTGDLDRKSASGGQLLQMAFEARDVRDDKSLVA